MKADWAHWAMESIIVGGPSDNNIRHYVHLVMQKGCSHEKNTLETSEYYTQ